jgi:uncharacterized protein (TIGR00106 family)
MIVEMSVDPIGAGSHVHELIARVLETVRTSGLAHEFHAMGTNIEGEWDEVMPVVKQCMERLLGEGVQRMVLSLRITERRDGTPNTLRHMKEAIEPHLLVAR